MVKGYILIRIMYRLIVNINHGVFIHCIYIKIAQTFLPASDTYTRHVHTQTAHYPDHNQAYTDLTPGNVCIHTVIHEVTQNRV